MHPIVPLVRRAALVAAFVALVLAICSTADTAVIDFTTPDIAATLECQGATVAMSVPLERYEELGVRVRTEEQHANKFMCDPTQAFGLLGMWQPLVLSGPQTSFGPLVYWWGDSAWLDVTSLSGQPIRGINLTIVEKGTTNWCSEIIGFGGSHFITLCDDFDGWVNFADYGLPDGLTSFRLDFGVSGRPYFYDPYVKLNAIDVPEPGAFGLVSIAVIAFVRRRR